MSYPAFILLAAGEWPSNATIIAVCVVVLAVAAMTEYGRGLFKEILMAVFGLAIIYALFLLVIALNGKN